MFNAYPPFIGTGRGEELRNVQKFLELLSTIEHDRMSIESRCQIDFGLERLSDNLGLPLLCEFRQDQLAVFE